MTREQLEEIKKLAEAGTVDRWSAAEAGFNAAMRKYALPLVEALKEARAERDTFKAECASISEEFGLPPTIRPSEGEITRMLKGWEEALAEVERLREVVRQVHALVSGEMEWTIDRVAYPIREIHKITKEMSE